MSDEPPFLRMSICGAASHPEGDGGRPLFNEVIDDARNWFALTFDQSLKDENPQRVPGNLRSS